MPKQRGGEPRRPRVYQQWQGNERFFCWGHCVTGPSWKSGLGSLALLIAPTAVFLVFVAPYMAARVSPAILAVSCVLPVFCTSMLLLTSCSDPGILPRQEPDEEWLQNRKPRAKDLCVNGHRVTVRYNDTCHFYQPPRAHHCSVNDNCIERFDHHCPWVGTTIGKRNYRTFLLFIYSTSLYIAWTFGVSLGSLFVRHRELAAAAPPPDGDPAGNNLWLATLGQSGPAIALMIFTFVFFWFVCGLSGFHTWLVASNQTTYENFRYNHNQVPNPYSQGLFRNCYSVWCVPVPPSKVHFRAFLDEAPKVPVEMGYPEWGAQPPPQQQLQHHALSVAAPAAAASDGASGGLCSPGPLGAQQQQQQLGGGGHHFAGGAFDGAMETQSCDSVTEGCSAQAPIARLDGSTASYAAAQGGSPAEYHQQGAGQQGTYVGGSGAQWQQQQQGGTWGAYGGAAAAAAANGNSSGGAPHGAGGHGGGTIAAGDVAIELAAAPYHDDPPPHGGKQQPGGQAPAGGPRLDSLASIGGAGAAWTPAAGGRGSAAGGGLELRGGAAAADRASVATEYVDALQESDGGSWASREE